MSEEAPFHAADEEVQSKHTHSPVPIPPRGEIVAWFFTFILTGLSGVLIWRVGTLPFWAPLFTFLALLLALSIRFSRWLESNSSIQVNPEGIRYSSPVRKHDFRWSEISKLIAEPAGNGWRIYVLGPSGGFRFQTETTLRGMRGATVRTGYPRGADIVSQLLKMADLGVTSTERSSWVWERG